jgi:UDP-N-acetylglucosamine acyltransferase
MARIVSPLSQVDSRAQIGDDVEIGPFCVVGPHVTLGNGCKLDSHVALTGHTTIGERNRFFPGSVIGGEPQDIGYMGSDTRVEIGDDNLFREGVTVNRGADKEDGVTRIGHRNFLMANAHVAHNCHVFNNVILCNGSLLGGHVHVQDFAIVSGNSVVHHFATLGTGCFISGGCRAPQDIPPYIREHLKLEEAREKLAAQSTGTIPMELMTLLNFCEQSAKGKNGRAREALRAKPVASQEQKAA